MHPNRQEIRHEFKIYLVAKNEMFQEAHQVS